MYQLSHLSEGADIRSCDFCLIAGDHNAHTMLEYLPTGMEYLREDAEAAAVASVADIQDDELICWCGHSLHYQDCPSGGLCHDAELDETTHGFCRQRYTMEPAYIEARWVCPGVESEHWHKGGGWIDEDDHAQGYAGRCGHCGSMTITRGAETVYDEDAL